MEQFETQERENKKEKECNSLAKMFVFFFFSVADTVHRILQKPKQTLSQTNSDKNNLNNNLEFGKVNTISKLKIQDTLEEEMGQLVRHTIFKLWKPIRNNPKTLRDLCS